MYAQNATLKVLLKVAKENLPLKLKEEEEIYFSKQNYSVELVACLNTYMSNKKTLQYNIEEHILANAGYKYSDVANDLN